MAPPLGTHELAATDAPARAGVCAALGRTALACERGLGFVRRARTANGGIRGLEKTGGQRPRTVTPRR